MTLEEMKAKSDMLRERVEKSEFLLREVASMRQLDTGQAQSIKYRSGIAASVVCDDLLQDVLRRGINAAIEWREIEILKLLDIAVKCEPCGGLGTPSGEAAGLVCGACNGIGVEIDEEID